MCLLAGQRLADTLREYMLTLGVPNGLAAVGYSGADIPTLVEATLPQKRLLSLVPSSTAAEDLAGLLSRSLSVY
jgi:hydroxyacid-oxoacid transhydrogenase